MRVGRHNCAVVHLMLAFCGLVVKSKLNHSVNLFPTRLFLCCTNEYAHTYDVSVYLCPNSIRFILSETRSPTCRRPGGRQVGDQVSDFFICRLPKFHWIYLVLSETRSATFLFVENLSLDLSRHVEIDLSCWRPGPRLFWSLTCLRHVGDLVLSRF